MRFLVLLLLVVLSSCATIAAPPEAGFYLGECVVPAGGQVASVTLDGYEGRAVALQLVADNAIELHDVILFASDGEGENLASSLTLSPSSPGQMIPLRGWRRHVRAIQFAYVPLGTWTTPQAVIKVYALGRNDVE